MVHAICNDGNSKKYRGNGSKEIKIGKVMSTSIYLSLP